VFTRIVVGYNDSPRARRALAAAVRMAAEANDAELIAVAVQRSLLLSGDTIGEVRDAHAASERACTGWLSAALAYADQRGAELRTEIRIGPLARQLATAAAAHHADLLVLGSSRVGARRPFSGGTADRVSRRSRCPVMIVP
jgi:nucleotide-binding universal stress UspA family protein